MAYRAAASSCGMGVAVAGWVAAPFAVTALFDVSGHVGAHDSLEAIGLFPWLVDLATGSLAGFASAVSFPWGYVHRSLPRPRQ